VPTTAGGIVYPSPTDDPDVPGDLAIMAASIETGNPNVATGVTAGTGWSVVAASTRLRRIGGLALIHLEFTRTGAAIVPTSSGTITPTETMGTLPAGWLPGVVCGYYMANSQAAAFGFIDQTGNVSLNRTFPAVNIATGITIRVESMWAMT